MAHLESIRFVPHRSQIISGGVRWEHADWEPSIDGLPQIFWESGAPWREANLWLHKRATSDGVDTSTVQAGANGLLTYAKWLEANSTEWWDFPQRKSERCLIRYRKALIQTRDCGELAPSTATQRMRVVVAFYKWLAESGLIASQWPMWKDQTVGVRVADNVGFERTLLVATVIPPLLTDTKSGARRQAPVSALG